MNKIFTSFLVTSFLATSFLCSCVGSAETFLDSDVHHDESDCHSHQDKSDHSSKKDCDCCATKIINADITAKNVLAVPGSLSQQSFIFSSTFLNRNIDLKQNLSYAHGPPGSVSLVPLYIQFHSLRI